MKFGTAQKRRFGTDNGAYSVVTKREHHDSQVTLTDFEAELVVRHYGQANLHIGNVGQDREKAAKTLFLYPEGEEITLNIVYPKPHKTELRLYLAERAGFKPQGGQIWFIFVKNNKLWIGEMSKLEWRAKSSILIDDETDFAYQQQLEEFNPNDILRQKERDVFKRKKSVALQRFSISGYKCEYDPLHSLFTSRASGKPYLEAHHLIPMALQSNINWSLDTVDNVFCLCPYCHRAVHHAEEDLTREILLSLASKRDVLSKFQLSEPELLSFYAVEEIV